ncbi:MarR family winged helix-turn-helix transcriptional regulator [Oryzifoliimicrobium ureilyticus]|uniref:MarR family winged helix-turn-helix transcriptional regulator n=1 Tax=Oryzifoliimicrobium ureilyticus TaxID=3113724 RepID=UPI003075F22E
MVEEDIQERPVLEVYVESIGESMSRMRLLTARRIIARLAVSTVAPELEVSHLDALHAVVRAEQTGEVTVGTVAEALRIDPSRASRIVSDMVNRNVLRRKASQSDARRIVVVVTAKGQKLLSELRRQKLSVVSEIVKDWPKQDTERFAALYERYMNGLEEVISTRGKEIAESSER